MWPIGTDSWGDRKVFGLSYHTYAFSTYVPIWWFEIKLPDLKFTWQWSGFYTNRTYVNHYLCCHTVSKPLPAPLLNQSLFNFLINSSVLLGVRWPCVKSQFIFDRVSGYLITYSRFTIRLDPWRVSYENAEVNQWSTINRLTLLRLANTQGRTTDSCMFRRIVLVK